VAQVVERLSSRLEALSSNPSIIKKKKLEYETVIPALGRPRQVDHEFEVSLGYTVNLRPA
jgi:hypothetical protein